VTPRSAMHALAAVVLLALALPAAGADSADGHRWYVGGGIGFAHPQNRLSRLIQPRISCVQPALGRLQECVRTSGDDEFTGTVFGGFQYNRYLALEVGYTDLPDTYNVRLVDPNVPSPAVIDVSQDSRALSVQGVVTLPLSELSPQPLLERLSISAAVGVARWRTGTDLDIDLTGVAGGFRSHADDVDYGTSLVLGARLNYDVTQQVRVSAAWNRFQDLGRSATALVPPLANPNLPPFAGPPVNTVRVDVDVFTLNVSYRF